MKDGISFLPDAEVSSAPACLHQPLLRADVSVATPLPEGDGRDFSPSTVFCVSDENARAAAASSSVGGGVSSDNNPAAAATVASPNQQAPQLS